MSTRCADATLALRRGELGVLLGRSGSGKSTLLTLLAGWQQPDTGEIRAGTGPAALHWAELGYLPQRFGLVPELTVRENVELPARLTGRREDLASRIDELLGEPRARRARARRPPETSIGQQQRTALARALVLQPTVLIADEPSSHQDAGWHEAVWALLAAGSRRGTACLVATHEAEADSTPRSVWEIAEGVLAAPR